MQLLTVSIKTEETKNKIIWFLQHLETEGVEIISQEDINDLCLQIATKSEKTVSFAEYLTKLAATKAVNLEKKQKEGYTKHPVASGEFDDLENEQVWCDDETW